MSLNQYHLTLAFTFFVQQVVPGKASRSLCAAVACGLFQTLLLEDQPEVSVVEQLTSVCSDGLSVSLGFTDSRGAWWRFNANVFVKYTYFSLRGISQSLSDLIAGAPACESLVCSSVWELHGFFYRSVLRWQRHHGLFHSVNIILGSRSRFGPRGPSTSPQCIMVECHGWPPRTARIMHSCRCIITLAVNEDEHQPDCTTLSKLWRDR